ncbi:MAG TPA: hypothetical protein VHV31_09990 [Nitrolancea sp.]|jgi:hypothetical protein|nr:hypothetical protein [Nitrolancea sp.]
MDPILEATELLRDCIAPVVRRINVDEFTTVEFIDVLQQDDDGLRAYELAVNCWPHDEGLGKMVVHGQIIPELLRMTGLVEWAGFAYDEVDPYAIPAWWRRT